MVTEEKLIAFKNELDKKSNHYFEKYLNREKDADYYLFLGKCSAFNDAIELIDEMLLNN